MPAAHAITDGMTPALTGTARRGERTIDATALRARPRRLLLPLLAVPLIATLAACGGTADASGTSSSSTTTSTSPSPTPSPTPTTYDVLGHLPDAAKQNTREGAQAFVKYFWEASSKVNESPSPGELSKLCLPDCKACIDSEKNTAWLLANDLYISSPELVVNGTSMAPDDYDTEEASVLIGVRQLTTQLLSRSGAPAKPWTTEEQVALRTKLAWTPLGWRVVAAKTVETVKKP